MRTNQGLDTLYQRSTQAATRLTIGVDSSVADNWLRQRFVHVREHTPAIQIELQLLTSSAPLKQVYRQIIYGNGSWPGYESELFLQPGDLVVCSPDLIKQGPPLETLHDLQNHCLINEFSVNVWTEWLRDAVAPEIHTRCGPIVHNSLVCLEMAANGEGVILSDDLVAANGLFDGRLIKPLPMVVTSQTGYLPDLPTRAAGKRQRSRVYCLD